MHALSHSSKNQSNHNTLDSGCRASWGRRGSAQEDKARILSAERGGESLETFLCEYFVLDHGSRCRQRTTTPLGWLAQ